MLKHTPNPTHLYQILKQRPNGAEVLSFPERPRKRNPALDELQELKSTLEDVPKHSKFERLTDKIVDLLSRPGAVIGQAALVVGYITINTLALTKTITFDPYPFLFLNLAFSVISGFTTVFVLNSNRRQDAENKAQTDAQVKQTEMILKSLERIEAHCKGEQWKDETKMGGEP